MNRKKREKKTAPYRNQILFSFSTDKDERNDPDKSEFTKLPIVFTVEMPGLNFELERAGRALTHGGADRLAQQADPCVCSLALRVMAALLFAVSKGIARAETWTVMVRPIELSTEVWRLEAFR